MTPSHEPNDAAAPASTLEIEADSKLQLSHRCATFQGRNLAVVAPLAINTAVSSIVRAEGIDRVIEHVEGIHAELRAKPLCDPKLLHR